MADDSVSSRTEFKLHAGIIDAEEYSGKDRGRNPNDPGSLGSVPRPIPVPAREASSDDEDIRQFLAESIPKIAVVGCGGSGCNTLARMQAVGIRGATFFALNTDAQDLLKIKADGKILIGRKTTRGRGAGSNPTVGEAAANESIEDIKAKLSGFDLVFVTCGLGGGTGTGSAHVVAKSAKDGGALVISVCTLPFSSEGFKRTENAQIGLKKLRSYADTTIAIPNDKLLYFVPDLPLNSAFKAADQVLTDAVKGITELITKSGLVNLDFADVRTILSSGGLSMIGIGSVSGKGADKGDRVIEAAERALESPLLELELSEADRALINITGGPDMTLGEAEAAIMAVSKRISKEAHIIWGATIDENMEKNSIRVLAVISGIKSEKPEDVVNVDFIE